MPSQRKFGTNISGLSFPDQKKTHPAKCAVCGTERTVTTLREHFEAGWRYTNDSPQRSLCPEHAS